MLVDDVLKRLDRAYDAVSDLASTGGKSWRMRIPAHAEDSDRLIGEALLLAKKVIGGRVESQQSIAQWAAATFGEPGSDMRIACRANEEMAELLRALSISAATSEGYRHRATESAAGEAADVVIVLFRLAERMGFDLLAEVDRKMAVNRARRWEVDKSGCGQHVRAPFSVTGLETAKGA
jgi:hypothetical protein